MNGENAGTSCRHSQHCRRSRSIALAAEMDAVLERSGEQQGQLLHNLQSLVRARVETCSRREEPWLNSKNDKCFRLWQRHATHVYKGSRSSYKAVSRQTWKEWHQSPVLQQRHSTRDISKLDAPHVVSSSINRRTPQFPRNKLSFGAKSLVELHLCCLQSRK